ncbi:hypothetical protein CEXT_70201 [Caerostris extrusa]|uniref:Uncharacterized protein n=1 Tax=Caerostris extrusa TaxID=172846 RepID=A0AAV4X6Z5_CAEEX|nr:hypothetical protein CEXT_70201 [Caerostris extrusa]
MRDGRYGITLSPVSRTRKGDACNPGTACLKSTNTRFDKDIPQAEFRMAWLRTLKHSHCFSTQDLHQEWDSLENSFCTMSRPGYLA